MSQRSLLTIGLLAVLCLVGCAPAVQPATALPMTLPVTERPVEPSPIPTATVPQQQVAEATATPVPADTPIPAATSRGPNLEATDPATVNLSSGDLQLVEFFRYT